MELECPIGTAFKGNTKITKFNELTWFPNLTISAYAFDKCSSLLEATFPPKMTTSAYAFTGCSALRKLNMNNVTSIGYAALRIPCRDGHTHLYLCEGFTTLVRANNPGRYVYAIYVPDEAVDAYKAAWPDRASKIHPMSELKV